jgi:RimJ/RimL family protein N-acetyltransferase
MRENVTKFLENQHRGRDLPFTVVDAKTEELVGMSRFLDIERPNRAVEIGGSWLTPTRWRTPFNTEMKWLMLRYAFEVERFHRVQFRADLRNERSQRAIERIGALREGVLREHVVLWDGFLRSSASYSILEQEWPVVKENLREILRRPWPAKVTDSP